MPPKLIYVRYIIYKPKKKKGKKETKKIGEDPPNVI